VILALQSTVLNWTSVFSTPRFEKTAQAETRIQNKHYSDHTNELEFKQKERKDKKRTQQKRNTVTTRKKKVEIGLNQPNDVNEKTKWQ